MHPRRILCINLLAITLNFTASIAWACPIKRDLPPTDYAWGKAISNPKDFLSYTEINGKKQFTAYEKTDFIVDFTLIKTIKNPSGEDAYDSPVAYKIRFDQIIKNNIEKISHFFLPIPDKKNYKEMILIPFFIIHNNCGDISTYKGDLNTTKKKGRLFFNFLGNTGWRVLYTEDITDPKDKALLKEMNQQYLK